MPVTVNERPKIMYSCYFARSREGEQFVPEHVFSMQVAGTLYVSDGVHDHTFGEGDLRLSRRNTLAKFLKVPPENDEFKSLSIYLDQQTLRTLAQELDIRDVPTKHATDGDPVVVLKKHHLYKSFMDSLLAYLQLPEREQQALMDIKVKEAVQLLLKIDPQVRQVLFNFNEPGKIDLEAFMERNYHFNVGLQRFAYLTGRSLSTFKRDFEKVFGSTPSRWLVQRRLREAYYLMREKGRAASDVYLDVGFENLSHFSYAFKKAYGASPKQLFA